MIRDSKNFPFFAGRPLGFVKSKRPPLDPDINIPYSNVKGSYIKINGVTYVEGAVDSFTEYKFKLNRQGGSDSTIKFNTLSGVFNINDSVEYYLNGVKRFSGYVSSVDDNGLTLKVAPLWYRLKNQTIQGSLILESTLSVYDAIIKLKGKITEIGIKFNDDDIDTKYKNYSVTCSYSGRNLVDILDDIVSNCSDVTVWGVDVNGLFYFKEFSEEADDILSWYNNDFSDSEYTRDSSDLYTAYVVKRKTFNADGTVDDNTTETLPLRVGIETGKPPAFFDEVGLRVGLFEYPFSVSKDDVAYAYANEQLQKQFIKESTKLKKINKDIEINKAYKIVCKPVENYYRDIKIAVTEGSVITNNYIANYDLIECDDLVDSDFLGDIFDTNKVDLITIDDYYLKACNEALDITYIYLYWYDTKDKPADSCIIKVNDGNIERSFNSVGGIAKLDCRSMDKRHIKVESNIVTVVFKKMRVYFSQGSRVIIQNAIEIEYSYKKNVLEIAGSFSKLNTVLTNYFFNEAKKVKDLNNLFTSKE